MHNRYVGPLLVIVILSAGIGCGGPQRPPPPPGVELRGNRIVLSDRILFEHDSARILPESHSILDRVVSLLDSYDEIIRVQVQGYTSTDGQTQRNQELSTERAAAVATYLREHGVLQEVTSQGFGEEYPLCTEETPECHDRNRRVEFYVDLR